MYFPNVIHFSLCSYHLLMVLIVYSVLYQYIHDVKNMLEQTHCTNGIERNYQGRKSKLNLFNSELNRFNSIPFAVKLMIFV